MEVIIWNFKKEKKVTEFILAKKSKGRTISIATKKLRINFKSKKRKKKAKKNPIHLVINESDVI
jgi:hypothetical protein